MRAWIEMVPIEQAEGRLRELYDEVKTPHGTVDNVMRVHSLRPHTMEGHLALYRSVLHSADNVLPLWYLETVASYVSHLNRCDYAWAHHSANMRRLIGEPARARAVETALLTDTPQRAFTGKELALLNYARTLTLDVGGIDMHDFRACRAAGASDGEILEINQVTAYFNYSNRLLNGLGVSTEGDVIGYYQPGDE